MAISKFQVSQNSHFKYFKIRISTNAHKQMLTNKNAHKLTTIWKNAHKQKMLPTHNKK